MSWLTDALDYAGGTLDKPGRAVRGALGGHGDELAAVVPFSDSLGITDPTRAVSGQDLVKNTFGSTGSDLADTILGFGAEMATDPMTYMGAGIGRGIGRLAGRGLESAAAARGPGYAGKLEDVVRPAGDILEMLKGHGINVPVGGEERAVQMARTADESHMMKLVAQNPAVLSEIPPGSRQLGRGNYGIAMETPAGDVLRIGPTDVGAPGRPISENMLQPTRTVDYPAGPGQAIRAERVPKASGVGEGAADYWLQGAYPPADGALAADYATGALPDYLKQNRVDWLGSQAQKEGLFFHDNHLGNVGIHQGRPVIIDPGAFEPKLGSTGVPSGTPLSGSSPVMSPGFAADLELDPQMAAAWQSAPSFQGGFNQVVNPRQPGGLTRAILDALGGQPAMQRALNRGLAAPTYQRDLGRTGALAGALLGAT